MPNENSEVFHTALRQIETGIKRKIRRGILHMHGANPNSIKQLALTTYQEAARKTKECIDPDKKGEFFKRAGVACDIIQKLLHQNQKG